MRYINLLTHLPTLHFPFISAFLFLQSSFLHSIKSNSRSAAVSSVSGVWGEPGYHRKRFLCICSLKASDKRWQWLWVRFMTTAQLLLFTIHRIYWAHFFLKSAPVAIKVHSGLCYRLLAGKSTFSHSIFWLCWPIDLDFCVCMGHDRSSSETKCQGRRSRSGLRI